MKNIPIIESPSELRAFLDSLPAGTKRAFPAVRLQSDSDAIKTVELSIELWQDLSAISGMDPAVELFNVLTTEAQAEYEQLQNTSSSVEDDVMILDPKPSTFERQITIDDDSRVMSILINSVLYKIEPKFILKDPLVKGGKKRPTLTYEIPMSILSKEPNDHKVNEGISIEEDS